LRAAQHVGVIRTEGVEVRIRPKVPVERVLFLAAYATDQTGWTDTVAQFVETPDLVAGIAAGFVTHAERSLARGVLQGYKRVEEALPIVRGRLREAAQATRRFGLPVPLEVTYDDFTIDILENQLLKSAARRLLLLPLVSTSVRRRLQRIALQVGGASELPPGGPVPVVHFDRLNERFRSSLALARLVLERSSVDLAHGDRDSVAFLFDMNRVFEDFVTAAIAPELERFGGRVEAQHRTFLDEGAAIAIRPDITWWSGSTCRAAIDAKYKSIATTALPNADVYQVFAYAVSLGLAEVHLVYAAGNERPATHIVRHAGTAIHAHALDLDQTPQMLLSGVRGLAEQIAFASSRTAA
jgi:5-methylcytosine-specific restriction enzyme subunit McrC